MQRISRITALIAVVCIVSVVLLPVTGVASADEPHTQSEYLDTLNEMDGYEVYDEVEEINEIHAQSITDIQFVENFDDEDREHFDAVITLLDEFEHVHTNVEDDEYGDALAISEQLLNETIPSLDASEYGGIATRSELGFDRYHEQLGTDLAVQADETTMTAEEITMRNYSAWAHELADNPAQAAEQRSFEEQLSIELSADQEQINTSRSNAEAFADSCTECDSPVAAAQTYLFDIFTQYEAASAEYDNASQAATLTERHNLGGSVTDERLADQILEQQFMLGIGALIIMVSYGAIIGLIVAVIFTRLFRWKRTHEAAQVDSVVVIGDIND